jgi:predicted transcriptional regulator
LLRGDHLAIEDAFLTPARSKLQLVGDHIEALTRDAGCAPSVGGLPVLRRLDPHTSALILARMAQVTIYLDDETEGRMKEAARAAGVSYSRWIAELIAERTRTEWPQSVVDLAGAWADDERVERPELGADLARERF